MFLRLTSILYFAMLPCGCLKFGPDVSTTTPTSADVARCRTEMYIDPDIHIRPQGFKLTSGIDDSIWFKFVAETSDITDVFAVHVVDTSSFTKKFALRSDSTTSWWDVPAHSLTGGQVSLPNARFMNVGYRDNADDTLTVYIMWHET